MSSINHVIIVGRVGRDPEMRYAPSGMAIANMSVATSERKKVDGEWTEATEWHRIVLYDKLAEVAGEYVRTGSLVGIEGRISSREYVERNTNAKRRTTEIIASALRLLGSRNDDRQPREAPPGSHQPAMNSAPAGSDRQRQAAAARPPRAPAPPAAGTGSGFDDMDDDIPF